MRSALCAIVVSLGLDAAPSLAQSDLGSVGLAWDPAGEVCNLNIGVDDTATLYILAYLTGAFAGGITGSEFRVTGFPLDWPVNVTPNPESVVTLGNPLGPGCNIAFPTCQMGSKGVALLYTVQFVATSPVNEQVLSVIGHATPSNPQFPCPRLIICDSPADLWACSDGRAASINHPDYCVTGVESTSWSALRSLYR